MTSTSTIETIPLTLAMALSRKEAREVATDAMSSLGRSGFLLTVRTRARR
jgi:hypothetical protein